MNGLAPVALACLVIVGGCGRSNPASSAAAASQASPTAPPVRTARVALGSVSATVEGFGTVGGGANAQASLAFSQAGRIASVDVVVGQRVVAGSTLARLEQGPFEAQLREAGAALAVAQANYAKVAAGSRPQTIAATNAQLADARTQLALAQAKLARQRNLEAIGIGARSEVDAASAQVADAASALRVLELAQSAQRVPWAPDLAAARAGVAQSEAELFAARQVLRSTELHAPFAGVVTARLHQIGESVDATSPIVTITKPGSAVFTAQLAPNDAQRVHPGDRALIRISGTSTPARGRVSAINSVQNAEAHTVPVLINFVSPAAGFGEGAYGDASIVVGSRRALSVPSAAVVADPTTGVSQVFRRNGDHFDPVTIAIESEAAGRTWVAGRDLHAGDVIVAQGAYSLLVPTANGNQEP